MIKRWSGLLLTLLILVSGLGAAQAITPDMPADTAIHYPSNTAYIIDNANNLLKVYSFNDHEWSEVPAEHEALPGECYGIAVEGNTLYVSVSNGSASEVREYALNSTTGNPTTYTTMTGDYWASVSVPTGVAVGGNNRLFVADGKVGRFLVYDTSSGSFSQQVISVLQGRSNMYGMAVSSTSGSSYKIFLSQRAADGKIYVFDYNNDTITYEQTISGLSYPTYLKVSGSRLYVAVNGTDGVDVKVYETSGGYAHVGDVQSGIVGSYGWTGFAISADGNDIFIKKAANSGETVNEISGTPTAGISGTVTAGIIDTTTSTAPSDGIVVSDNNQRAALGNSPDGTYQLVNLQVSNQSPDAPTSLGQYQEDGITAIAKEGTALSTTVVFKFDVSDPDGGMLTPFVAYKVFGSNSPQTVEGPPVQSGSTATVTVQGLTDGADYEWMAFASDGVEQSAGIAAFDDDSLVPGATPDFVVRVGGADFEITETSPVDQATNVPLNAPIVIKFNREVNLSTFNLNITPTVNFEGAVWSEGNTRVALPHVGDLFQTGAQYTFDVTAQDTNLNSLTGQTSFTFTASSDPNRLAPYIVETTPVADEIDVTLAQSIIVRFSQEMNASSFSGSITSGNDPAGWRPDEWNATDTQVTLVHDNPFAQIAAYTYQVDSTTAGSNGLALIPGLVPNPFSFTTGTDIGDPIVNIEVTRDSDDPGSSITITWDTIPPGIGVDVYKLTCNTDANGEYTSYFTTTAAQWTLEQSNITSGTYTIQNQVGTGTAEYYKLIPTGNTLQAADLETNIAGKFDLAVGPTTTQPERFFVSVPLSVSDPAVTSVIGGQVTDMDMIVSFDIDKNVTAGSMYQAGNWVIFPGAPASIDNLEAGYAYGYITSASKFITLVGMMRETNLSRSLVGGTPMVAEWIANPYPAPVPVADAGLNSSSFSSTNPLDAGTIYHFDADANLVNGTDGMAFHTGATEWKDGTLTNPSPLQMIPGKGYMFTEPVQNSFNWDIQP